MIENRVDPDATRPADLGPCRCPGQPHTGDSAVVVRLFSYAERGVIRQAARLGGMEAGELMAIARGTRSWSLVLADGSPRPLTTEEINLLDVGTVKALLRELDPAFDEDPLPKARSARSLNGSPASATSTQMTPAPISSTTA